MNSRKYLEVALGILTSTGGFLEVGAIATAAQAGASFGYQLMWALLLGTVCVTFLVEMSGRLAATSGHPLPAAVRERFGFNFYLFPVAAQTLVDFLVLASEIGGSALALQLVTGIDYRWWAVPVALLVWLLLWLGTFNVIEYGVSILGLVTIVCVVAAFKAHPQMPEVAKGLLPTLPRHDKAHYWFLAVSIIGAIISPYLFNFYSSGAIEDEWGEDHIGVNRAIAIIGMVFGCVIAAGMLVAAAAILHPRGVEVERYEQVPLAVTATLGKWGFFLFAAGLFVACVGAAIEISLDGAYVFSQSFGWNWGEDEKPRDAARFSFVYTLMPFVACLPMALGLDPLTVTLFSMAITTVILPVIVLPFLVLMNDDHYVGRHRNGFVGNAVVFVTIVLAAVMAVVAIPLEIFGGS
jgi:Mn2+/Fe2+ NRAMP family transporter